VVAETLSAGLRIDVDTMRGTEIGVPNLVSILAKHGIHATFFFSVGPDNMGRHLWRLFRPSFLFKMLRSKAVSLYGYDILLRGTFWPGALIGDKAAPQIRLAAIEHEIGLHAWDHHREQTSIEKMSDKEIARCIDRGKRSLEAIIDRKVGCMAAPSWKATDTLLKVKETFELLYNSDCRGFSMFQPIVEGQVMDQYQIPTTLPTYDEVVGKNGITAENYNEYILNLFRPGNLNVLTIHAEVEGISCKGMFSDFLVDATKKGIQFQPLGELIDKNCKTATAEIIKEEVPGRDGWVGLQKTREGKN
jgi:undecaprenyl phosphate-alpha-L-ara4FN deformylase